MRNLTCQFVEAAWLLSLTTTAVTEPFYKMSRESEMRQDTIPVFQVETVQFEVEVKVPQVSIRVGVSRTLHAVIVIHI